MIDYQTSKTFKSEKMQIQSYVQWCQVRVLGKECIFLTLLLIGLSSCLTPRGPGSLIAKSIAIVDEDGATRVSLRWDEEVRSSQLVFYDAAGNEIIGLGVLSDTGVIVMRQFEDGELSHEAILEPGGLQISGSSAEKKLLPFVELSASKEQVIYGYKNAGEQWVWRPGR